MACPECTSLHEACVQYNEKYSRLFVAYERKAANNRLENPFGQSLHPPNYEGMGAQKALVEHIDKCNFHKKHNGNGTYSGPFAFTLTKSPKDDLTVGDMLKAVEKVLTQKSCPVAQYSWYLEYKGVDEDGLPIHPHIHGMYETHSQGRIEAKHFKRAWPIWKESERQGQGFRGGYHRPIKAEESYKDYIAKDGGIGKSLIQPD